MDFVPARVVAKPRLLFRPDPVIGWALSPQHAVKVGFRMDIMQTIGADGWRHVPDRPKLGPNIGIYGCSFTYGTGLADAETYTAILQQNLPQARVMNRGIGGHGTVQNLLQLRRDIAAGTVDAAVFAVISDHRFRNIAHPHRMRQYLNRDWSDLGVEHVPLARLDAAGQVHIVYHPLWQPVIKQADFDIFLPDDFMINTATLAVLDRVQHTARAAGIPIKFAQLDTLDPDFSKAVTARFPDTIDISSPHDETHTFLPADIHPNAYANQLYAQRLLPAMTDLTARVQS